MGVEDRAVRCGDRSALNCQEGVRAVEIATPSAILGRDVFAGGAVTV